MLQSRHSTIYIEHRHGFLHGVLTFIVALWAISFPTLLLFLAAFGPIGVLVGVGAALLLGVPWLVGLVILLILHRII
jgi:hypothetical protein